MQQWKNVKPLTQHARLLGELEQSVSASSGVKVVEGRAVEEVEEAWRSTTTEAAA
jgi:hypothetical protein